MTASAPALAAPVTVFSMGAVRLTTRLLCETCANQVKPWRGEVLLPGQGALSRVYPAYVTDERLLVLIHLLKFSRRERIAPWLARAMAAQLADFSRAEGSVVIPVPMDRSSERRRGFNQAERIARPLAQHWGLRIEPRALVKVHRTQAQSTLGREERLVNVEGAFEADARLVREQDVIIVDDLVTTGATVRACAVALRAAEVRRVRAVCAGYRDEAGPLRGALPQS